MYTCAGVYLSAFFFPGAKSCGQKNCPGATAQLIKYACECINERVRVRPTQSMMYVPLQVNRCRKYFLLIVEYKYLKSCSGDFYSPESDPPHKIMWYWVSYSTQLCFGFPPDRICQAEMICIGGVPVLKRHFGGAGP